MTIYSHSVKNGIPSVTARFSGMRKEKKFVLIYRPWGEDLPIMLQSDNRIATVSICGQYRVTPASRKGSLVANYYEAEQRRSVKKGPLCDDEMQHLIEIYKYMARRNGNVN